MMMTPLWRRPFDAIERPLAAASESWVQSDTFMDMTATAFRMQRRLTADLHRYGERWLHAWGLLALGDVVKVSNQVASLERQVRELRLELQRHERQRLELERELGRRDGAGKQHAESERAA